ncbi:MAG TPA: Y-family DNA polymerase [Candidatus Saccharimonadales bacterium]|nr:Y-family DNA polymerase [Candidatus Saccharimonadales bacterium]
MSRIGLVDCNNFFVSCERVFRPDLATKPTAVLSNNDGCIVARSNEVKALGVPMGIPLFKVKDIVRRHGIQLLSANFELYGDMSQRLVRILRQVCPKIEVYSIDECFLDLTKLPIKDETVWAEELRARILHEIGIPVSIGLAPTKTLAKAAAQSAKRLEVGIAVMAGEAARRQILERLPIEDVWGIGRRLGPKLRDKGVVNAWQLTEASDTWLAHQFNITGLKMIDELRAKARIDFGDKRSHRQTIMRSRAFSHTVRDYHQLESAVASFTASAAQRLRGQSSVCAGVMTGLVSPRENNRFNRSTSLISLTEPTADTGRLITAALAGLKAGYEENAAYKKASVTLIGITGQDDWQLSLTDPDHLRQRRQRLMAEVDRLNRRFGGGTIGYAAEDQLASTWQSRREHRSPRYTTRWSDLPQLKA